MVRPNTAKWDHTSIDLLRLSIESDHPRTRERFLALYMISSGQKSATNWAGEIGRNRITVINWVHTYNENGPEALVYRKTGGRIPLFIQNKSISLSKQ